MAALFRRATCFLSIFFFIGGFLPRATLRSTVVEPCSENDNCTSLVGYTLHTDLKVSEVASIFSVDPISLLMANAIDVAYPDVEDHILPSQFFVKIPAAVSGCLISTDEIREANPNAKLSDFWAISVGTSLSIPLPCTCFNNTDNSLPAVYMSYVVRDGDKLAGIAPRYETTVSDLMNVNYLQNSKVKEGDILAIPLPACASNFSYNASDYGLLVPNGSYAITAGHCMQCSRGPGSPNLYCMPSPLSVSCSSMQCRDSNLTLGNVTKEQSSAGCNVTFCSYGGFVNGSIAAVCPGPQQFPTLIAPSTVVDGRIGGDYIFSLVCIIWFCMFCCCFSRVFMG